MALEIHVDPAARWVVAEERLWLTLDRLRLVAEGDAAAAFLFAVPGQQIDTAEAERYGLVKVEQAAPAEEAELAAETAETAELEPEPSAGLTVQPETKRSRVPTAKKRTKS